MKLKTYFSMAMLAILVVSVQMPVADAAKGDYLYRKRINWVKLEKLSNKQLGGLELSHPVTDIMPEQMVGMLMSIKMDKGSMFKKGYETNEVFSEEEARKYAPFIVEGLRKAAPNQVINVALVHRRPNMILRNDHLSIINIFKTSDGVHLNFAKLYAKLDGDYQAASNIDDAIRNAKSSRTRLSAQAGQSLLSDIDEIVIPVDFAYAPSPVETTPVTTGKNKTAVVSPVPQAATGMQNPTSGGDIKTRLQALDDLKNNKLITESEYQIKRREILGSL